MRIYSVNAAQRFVYEMVIFHSKIELLTKLDDDRKFGWERIRESLSWIKSNTDDGKILIPFLQVVLNKRLFSANETKYLVISDGSSASLNVAS